MIDLDVLKKRYGNEMALAILVLRVFLGQETSAGVNLYLRENDIDWNLFASIIKLHKLRPVVLKVFGANKSDLPVSFLNELRTASLQIATGNLCNLEELVKIHSLFKSRGIPAVVYKGVILSKQLYGDYVSRETSDIDFLVEPQQFSGAHDLLVANGYKPRYYNPDFESHILASSHEILYRKVTAKGPIKIEIHWAATSKMLHVPVPNSYLLQGGTALNLLGTDITVFSPDRHFLVLLIHHGVNDVWCSLRHVLDISSFVLRYSNEINWEEFKEATKKFGLFNTTVVGFCLARDLFGTEIPEVFRGDCVITTTVYNNLLGYPGIGKGKFSIGNLQQQLYLRDSLRNKIELIASYAKAGITPNIRDMEAYHLPKKWYPLYYLIKPYRFCKSRSKKSTSDFLK